jgi:AmmeMemoRadiSam system protein B/AmmeMemoRadiSam system protein A
MMTLEPPPSARPDLTAAQKGVLLAASAELIAAVAADRSPVLPDPKLAGAADVPLAGVFVSLKRGKHLRACTGGLRPHPVPLGQALADAAESTVLRDQRFPVVSPGEIAFLDLELWLLFNPQPVHARGEDRVNAVITGKHGLVVSRGGQHGLLLPGVAVEHGWGPRTFLEHVCQKAGMHPSLWKDDATSLMTFEGDVLNGRLGDFVEPAQAPPIVDREELKGYFDFCWDNIVAMFQGATLRYFQPGLRDIPVHGVTLRLKPPQASEPILLTNLALRPGSPVQNTLVQLAQAGAHQLAARGIRLGTLHTVGMGLTLFGDPHVHGTVERHDLRGFETAGRTAMVVERNKQGIVFRPDLPPGEVLAEAARQASVSTPASAGVFSLQVLSTDKLLTISTAPKPHRGPAERPSAVAGSFYPNDAESLGQIVTELLDASLPHALPPRPVPAAMVPHAGLRFSGAIAARVLQSIELPRTIVVIGPKHTPHGMDWAVAPHQTWHIPGAEIASDFMLARSLARAIPGLALDAAAHQREHAIEVELPFLARLAPQAHVIGIALAGGDWPAAQRFAEGLAVFIQSLPEPPLLLISSDMNHFATDDENRRLDEIALAALERLDPEAAFKEITDNNISMCGVFPAVIVMETLRRLGRLSKATRCGYATSADVTKDKDRVVGYAGMLFAS